MCIRDRIRLDDKTLIQGNEVNLKYAMKTTFEKEISSSLKPKTIDDYAKIISDVYKRQCLRCYL